MPQHVRNSMFGAGAHAFVACRQEHARLPVQRPDDSEPCVPQACPQEPLRHALTRVTQTRFRFRCKRRALLSRSLVFPPHSCSGRPLPSLCKALGNLRPGAKKRFILWDDFRPVEYADDDSIPVHLFLSLFIGQPTEIQAIAQQVLQVACALWRYPVSVLQHCSKVAEDSTLPTRCPNPSTTATRMFGGTRGWSSQGRRNQGFDEARAPHCACYSPKLADVGKLFSALLFAPHPHPHLQEGLWTPTKKVSAEDVSHMQNRVLHFHFNHVFGRGDLQEVPR